MKKKNNGTSSKGTLLLLSVPETAEEKEFLTLMGWKDGDEIDYEITDKDREEFEKQKKNFYQKLTIHRQH